MGTPPLEYPVLALRPPGNVERLINELRSRLFSRTLALSTQALPPSIYLACVDADTPVDVAASLPQEQIAPPVVGPPRVVEDTVIVSCTFDDQLTTWAARLPGRPAPGFLPSPCAGLFVGAADLLRNLDGHPEADGTLTIPEMRELAMPGHISVFTFELLVIRVRDMDRVWSDIEWEVQWNKRVKFRAQAMTT